MDIAEQPYGLRAGLRLCAVGDAADVARVAAFDAQIHGPGSEATWRALMVEHPQAALDGWLFIEEQASGLVVAALCLIPWRLRYCGVELRAAEMGVVGTLEAYRGQGLQRVLNQRFDQLLRAGGYELSHIQGIPYFYRQFGYEYAAPLEAWWRLELHMLPSDAPVSGFACRPATLDDLHSLMRMYDETAATLDIVALRDELTWRYLLGPGLETELAAETWLVHDRGSVPVGYFRVARQGFGEGLIVAEASALGFDGALAALTVIRKLALERGKPFVRLNLPANAALVTVARGLGAYDGGVYAWQVRLPDPAGFLSAVRAVLEQRVAASIFAGLSRDVVIDLYRQRVLLRFTAGSLSVVEGAPAAVPAALRLPPTLLAPLVFGHRSLAEIAHMYPDAFASGPARPLVEVLFPRLRAWLYQPY